MNHQIKEKSTGKIVEQSVDTDGLVSFIQAHPNDMHLYEIKPTEKKAKEGKDEKDMETLKEEFIKTLEPAQYNDLHLGIKELKYNALKKVWGLKTVKGRENEANRYTPQMAIKKREEMIEKAIRNDIKDNQVQMFTRVFENIENLDIKEFVTILDKITGGK